MTWPNVIPFHQRLPSLVKLLPSAARGWAHGGGGGSARGKRGGEGEELPEECALGFPERSHPFCSLPTAMLSSLLPLSRVCRFKVLGLPLQKKMAILFPTQPSPGISLLLPTSTAHGTCFQLPAEASFWSVFSSLPSITL